jgi:hypothetical protein
MRWSSARVVIFTLRRLRFAIASPFIELESR